MKILPSKQGNIMLITGILFQAHPVTSGCVATAFSLEVPGILFFKSAARAFGTDLALGHYMHKASDKLMLPDDLRNAGLPGKHPFLLLNRFVRTLGATILQKCFMANKRN